MSEQFEHVSVLLHESVDGLAIKPDGIYIDGTFGRGGHSRLILSKLGENGRLYSIDRDPQAIAEAQKIDDPRFNIIHGPFSGMEKYMEERDLIGRVDGILLDLGVSSPSWTMLSVALALCVTALLICVWIQLRVNQHLSG